MNPHVWLEVDDCGPTVAELDAIDCEMPLIEAEMDLVDAEIRVLVAEPEPAELDWYRLRRAKRRVVEVWVRCHHAEARYAPLARWTA